MRRAFIILFIPIFVSGCQATSSSSGSLLGGFLGGYMGAQFGEGQGRLLSTATGAAAGAAIGGSIGSQLDMVRENRVIQESGTGTMQDVNGAKLNYRDPMFGFGDWSATDLMSLPRNSYQDLRLRCRLDNNFLRCDGS